MNNKKIKYFAEHPFQVKLGELNKELKAYKELMQIVQKIEPNATSVSQLEAMLNLKTKFLNAEMSFAAFNLQNEYSKIQDLQKKCRNIESEMLTSKNEFKGSYLKKLEEEFKTYYDDNELQARETLQRIFKEFNELDLKYRAIVSYNNARLGYNPFHNLNI
ncbi:hypothetical protein [Polaribacter sp. MED152]|uniref:hypothetical protein n=1 Tax=Polaribacter sp. MED152 TaxID=313598 RepID=UPI000068C8E9|nr:hypothetical protein [Polaribacter sp. MED152]EAQ43030.1 hypothetical protein MED152_09910 [Polaribacter sp. MED152]